MFLVGATVLCAGIYLGGGMGKLLLLVGCCWFLGSLFGMLKIKSLEGKTAMKPGPEAMKLVGAVVAALGWVITLFGMHLTPSVGGRIITCAGRNCGEPFRDHRRFAGSLQQERGLEELNAPGFVPAAKIIMERNE